MASIIAPPKNWEEAILSAAVTQMNAKVCFYEADSDDYDWRTGSGGIGIRILWSGKARVQHLRAPHQFSTGYETGSDRAFRFQLDPGDSVPNLYEGFKARVIDGGRDSGLETLAYVVDSAINSSHMAVRTVELKANMRPMEWNWRLDENGAVIPA